MKPTHWLAVAALWALPGRAGPGRAWRWPLGLHSGTVNAVCEQYAKSRSQKNRPCLRCRGKKSLGWVPLKGRELQREGDAFRFAGNTFRVSHSRALPEGKIKDGTSFFGNVSASKLAKTRMAKSVCDASWSHFRLMLAYKALRHGAWFEEVNESYSSQVCSSCGALPDSRPRGIADLGIRQWVCSGCGVSHDRDTNAALNILARHGHVPPVVGIPVL